MRNHISNFLYRGYSGYRWKGSLGMSPQQQTNISSPSLTFRHQRVPFCITQNLRFSTEGNTEQNNSSNDTKRTSKISRDIYRIKVQRSPIDILNDEKVRQAERKALEVIEQKKGDYSNKNGDTISSKSKSQAIITAKDKEGGQSQLQSRTESTTKTREELMEEEELEEMFMEGPAGIEWGGPTRGGKHREPTRYGDWERNGRCSDFS